MNRHLRFAYFLLGLGVLLALGLIGGEIHSIVHQQNEINNLVLNLKDNVHSQATNRVMNVKAWCSALNQERDYSRHLANIYHTHYALQDLPCKKLAAATLKSSQ